jgi:hypothetical protein
MYKHLLKNSYSGHNARKELLQAIKHRQTIYPSKILTGLKIGLLTLMAWSFISFYLIVTH